MYCVFWENGMKYWCTVPNSNNMGLKELALTFVVQDEVLMRARVNVDPKVPAVGGVHVLKTTSSSTMRPAMPPFLPVTDRRVVPVSDLCDVPETTEWHNWRYEINNYNNAAIFGI
jgi:hypothetical protein